MVSSRNFLKNTIRPIALAVTSVAFGSLLVLLFEMFLNIEVSKLHTSIITFVCAAFSAFYLFPNKLQLPFKSVKRREYMRLLGFYLPRKAWKHIILGILLAVCTLSGMLVGSLLTGRYKLDWSTINLTHIIFSINPGLWEEFFYRGVIMFVLLRLTKSVRQASIIQIVLFSLAHIKGFDFWSWIDVISVMVFAIAFTYSAYKTRTLVAGIVFHFVHDALLFLPQVPRGGASGTYENIVFYASLCIMVGVSCIVIKVSADNLDVKADKELYTIEHTSHSQ